jgi:hypothetical protein
MLTVILSTMTGSLAWGPHIQQYCRHLCRKVAISVNVGPAPQYCNTGRENDKLCQNIPLSSGRGCYLYHNTDVSIMISAISSITAACPSIMAVTYSIMAVISCI